MKILTEEGLKILWSQISLSDYPNNDTLIAVIEAIDETKANRDELKNYYLKTEADILHREVEKYINNQVAALVGSAPETLNTLGELAEALQDNREVTEILDAAISLKANQSDLDTFKTENWTFTLSDGTSVTKKVVIK